MPFLTSAPLDPATVLAALQAPGLGGTALFLGTVRQGPDDGPVIAIEYSAYEAMAEAEAGRITAEAGQRWPQTRVVLQHRVGRVAVGEPSVLVVAASAHRAEAFAACRYVIEEVKHRLPVWKKELYADGTAGWRANDGTRQPAAAPRLLRQE
jgi:molybdopterin synthase catalytic subunit